MYQYLLRDVHEQPILRGFVYYYYYKTVSLPASSRDLASTTMVSFFRWDLGMAREACKRSFFAFNRACR